MIRCLFLLFSVCLFAQCSATGSFVESSGQMTQTPSPSPPKVAVTDLTPVSKEESDRLDRGRDVRLDRERKQLEEVPVVLKETDFRDYSFPFGRLKKGKLEIEREHLGGTTFNFGAVYYVDVTGSSAKEAIVEISEVNCGGSCDGGDTQFYFFAVSGERPKLIGVIKTGAQAGGCALKAISIESRSIQLEQYGRCVTRSDEASNWQEFTCKFCVKDETRSLYQFIKGRLRRSNVTVASTPELDIMNRAAEFHIENY